jgi:type IV secretory pathway TrbL component
MAKRTSAPVAPSDDSLVEQKVVQFAEQVGRVVGTIRATADGLIDRRALSAQMSAIRDAAADLLQHVGKGAPRADASAAGSAAAPRRSRGDVDAPGKRHRKPAPSRRGTKHSDTRIAKVKLAKTGRPPRRG